jgi:hypothetical protein
MEALMTEAGYAHFADALIFVHGPRALAEAARHAELSERTGDMETAARFRKAMRLVQGQGPGTNRKHCLAG